MIIVEIAFWVLAAVLFYVYLGYPVLLAVAAKMFGRPVKHMSTRPSVTLIISAYNELNVIAQKLENSIAIDYSREKLEVLVVSDASDDGTDDIVREYSNRQVKLVCMQERGGKTLGLNEAVKQASGEILVFSDANAMYRRDAVSNLVRNFCDHDVGAVVGESTYSESANDAERSESAYWRYETLIKRLESRVNSVVGGDGAIYAIRKKYYRPMAADALSDLVNPLQIIEQGKRCVYEAEAISEEQAAGSFDKEFRRKVRIVNRAWRATMSVKSLLNPFRHGVFAIQFISHKLLRWLMPAFLLLLLLCSALLWQQHFLYRVATTVQAAFYALALMGAFLRPYRELPFLLYVPFYFCMVNIASARGILEAYRGKTYTTWSTARSADHH